MDSVIILISIIITLVFSAFFSGMEIAFISANRLKIALDDKQGGVKAKILAYFAKKPASFIGTMLLGNNAAIVAYSMFMAMAIDGPLTALIGMAWLVLLIQTIITTILVLIFAEFLPKAIFRINPNRALSMLAFPLVIIYGILWLPTFLIIGLAELILKIFIRDKGDNSQIVFEKVDLDNYLEEYTTDVENSEVLDHEVKIFHNALNFADVIARDCMVPRNEIIAFEIEEDLIDLRGKFIQTGLSKILIYRETVDNIIGYIHSYELFKSPETIKSILLPVSIIPETINANKILEELISKNRSIALVVDEYGGTAGMVTMEDVIEEIFGEIQDEHDLSDVSNKKINETEFELNGRAEIDFLNEKFRLNLPLSEEYETLGGFIISEIQNIPKQGEVIRIGNFVITIKEVSNTKIEMVRVLLIEESGKAS
jgi:CBS domain containing-hemolysin-like protein